MWFRMWTISPLASAADNWSTSQAKEFMGSTWL